MLGMYMCIQKWKNGEFKKGGIKYQVVKKGIGLQIPAASWPSLLHGLAFLLGVLKILILMNISLL